MNFRLLAVFTRVITIELDNQDIYESTEPYDLYLNGKLILSSQTRNVCSVYDLEPATRYELTLSAASETVSQTVSTLSESVRLDVRRFGAKGDGVTADTSAIQAAILCCPPNGSVYLPAGVYMSGPLFLKSEMTLELAKGAVLRGITDREEYPILPGMTWTTDETGEYNLGSWEGNPLDSMASLLTGIGVHDISIIGRGVLDGNGDQGDWWIEPKKKRRAWRPRMLFFNRCRNIRVQGITITNSPAWTVHQYFCHDMDLVDFNIRNPDSSPNTDGIDIESCERVQVVGAHISVGDDCIAVKSGKMYMGQTYKTPSREITMRNCFLERGHGGLVIGSEVSAGAHQVSMVQSVFLRTDRGLRIKTRRGRGNQSFVDGITFSNVSMKEVGVAFVVNMFYSCDPDGKSEYVHSKNHSPVDQYTPRVGTIRCEDVTCENCSIAGAVFYGLPEMPVEDIELANILIRFRPDAEPGLPDMLEGVDSVRCLGLYASHVQKLKLRNVSIEGFEGERLQLENVGHFEEV